MTTVKDVPLSGYTISSIHTIRQRVEPREVAEGSEKGIANFGWDWRLIAEDLFEVLVTVTIEPDNDRPYETSVELVGRFRRLSPTPSVQLEDFAQLQAVAILLPYVRQFLATLTW